MFFERIVAVMLRHYRLMFRDFQHLSMLFYWPFIDLIIFGFNAVWMQQGCFDGELSSRAFVTVTCVVLWQVMTRGDLAVSFSLLDELWARNTVNLFGSPLRIGEWVAAIVCFSITMSLAVLVYCTAVVRIIYGVNILTLGLSMVPLIITSLLSGLWMGHFAAAMLIYFGARVQTLVWMMQWLFAPIIGVFFPVDLLPTAVQKVSYALPMTYAFDTVRDLILKGELNRTSLYISIVLNLLYLVLMIAFFAYMFRKSKNKGLARLAD